MASVTIAIIAAVLAFHTNFVSAGSCTHLNQCSGHGICDTENSRCNCYNGYGSSTDRALYKAPDCSLRSCPGDRAWVDIPVSSTSAHGIAECSNQGICDRSTGRCRCFAGYEGEACQRSACPGTPACSGHGKCATLRQMAQEPNAEPVGPSRQYGGDPDGATWDEEKIQGCVCDSSWPVGYQADQIQLPEWFGNDCSKQRCPSEDDPRTYDFVETDCEWYDDNGQTWKGIIGSDGKKYKTVASMPNGITVSRAATCTTPGVDCGAAGNKCFVECANRGICDYTTGLCACFKGYYGVHCGLKLTQM